VPTRGRRRRRADGKSGMKKIKEQFALLQNFFSDVGVEMKKCTWPSRQELIESTVVVIVSVLLISAFVGVSDKVLVSLLRLLIRMG